VKRERTPEERSAAQARNIAFRSRRAAAKLAREERKKEHSAKIAARRADKAKRFPLSTLPFERVGIDAQAIRQHTIGVYERVRVSLLRWHRATGGYEPGRPSRGVARVGIRLKVARRALQAHRDLASFLSMKVDEKDKRIKEAKGEVAVWEQRVANLSMESKLRAKEHKNWLMRSMSRERLEKFKAAEKARAQKVGA
jgi:hypothetical protein